MILIPILLSWRKIWRGRRKTKINTSWRKNMMLVLSVINAPPIVPRLPGSGGQRTDTDANTNTKWKNNISSRHHNNNHQQYWLIVILKSQLHSYNLTISPNTPKKMIFNTLRLNSSLSRVRSTNMSALLIDWLLLSFFKLWRMCLTLFLCFQLYYNL